ncbi:MAG: polysaccharide biosynthesis tyrosine autokinase [Prochlorococcus marinus CUG1439]|nr:polysaccharide biosynthesis tyrosine autokinase [Prochlorococcus marinus CUG1439]
MNNNNNQENYVDLSELGRSILRRKRLIIYISGFLFFWVCLYTFQKRITNPTYKGTFSLLISDPIDDAKSSNGLNQLAIIATGKSENDIPTLIGYLKSPSVLQSIALEFNKKVDDIQDNIKIERKKVGSRLTDGVLDITFFSKDPKKGELILQAISKKYLNIALQERQRKFTDGLLFLNEEYKKAEQILNSSQNKLSLFMEEKSVIEPLKEAAILKEKELKLINLIDNLNIEKKSLENSKKAIAEGKLFAKGLIKTNQFSKDNSFILGDGNQSLLDEMIKLENELARAKTKFTSSSKIIKGIKKRIDNLSPLLKEKQLESMDIAINSNKEEILNTNKTLDLLQKKLLNLPEVITKYNDLLAKVEVAGENLAGIQRTIEAFQLGVAQNSVPWRIIKAPEISKTPFKPSIIKYLFFGGFLSLISGVLLGLLRDQQDATIKKLEELNQYLNNIPLLAQLPYLYQYKDVRSDKKIFLKEVIKESSDKGEELRRFFAQEAFRNLSTSIRFLNTDKKINSFLITSSIPGEGKSLTNILLAKTIAEMGKKVLLIDADLRKPQLHQRLDINNLRGLSNLITDANIELKDVIQNIQIETTKIDVITSGVKPPDPLRILGSEKMKSIIKEIKESNNYDFVLFDSTPILGLSDSAIFANYLDGIILLVSLGYVSRKLPPESIKLINSYNLNLLGVISNVLDPKIDIENSISGYKGGYESYSSYAELNEEKNISPKEKSKKIKVNFKNKMFKKVLQDSFQILKHYVLKALEWLDK